MWGSSKLSESPPREDHSFQTFLLTLLLVPSLPSGRFCVPNGMLEQALPGWAPDAMQLIHLYGWEQVPCTSQAAPSKTMLQQAQGSPKAEDAHQLQKHPLDAPWNRGPRLHHLMLTDAAGRGAGRAPGAATASSSTPGQGRGAGAVTCSPAGMCSPP